MTFHQNIKQERKIKKKGKQTSNGENYTDTGQAWALEDCGHEWA